MNLTWFRLVSKMGHGHKLYGRALVWRIWAAVLHLPTPCPRRSPTLMKIRRAGGTRSPGARDGGHVPTNPTSSHDLSIGGFVLDHAPPSLRPTTVDWTTLGSTPASHMILSAAGAGVKP